MTKKRLAVSQLSPLMKIMHKMDGIVIDIIDYHNIDRVHQNLSIDTMQDVSRLLTIECQRLMELEGLE